MHTQLERKTSDCAGNNCPARYDVTDGPGKVFVGKRLDAATRAQLGIGPDEDAVWVPDDVAGQLV
jgi:hypothetical protein